MKKIYAIMLGFMISLGLTGIAFACESCKKQKKPRHHGVQYTTTKKTSENPQEPAAINKNGTKAQDIKAEVPSVPEADYIAPLVVLNNTAKYLNKPVHIRAKFDKFSTLGLDYPAAMRPSADYIAFMVQRNDVLDHNVPLSEMKLILKREYAEKFIDLDTNDVILIDGKMFSNALTDAWIDVDKIIIKEKVKKENK